MASSMASGSGDGEGDGQGHGRGRRQSLTKYVAKVKSALRRDKTSKTGATDSRSNEDEQTPVVVASSGPAKAKTPSEPSTAAPKDPKAAVSDPPQPVSNEPPTASTVSSSAPPPTTSTSPASRPQRTITENVQASSQKTFLSPPQRSTLQQDRARLLFAKYGLSISAEEWTFPATTPCARIHRPIRMRVHRHCHQCATAFGTSRVCPNGECAHPRCAKCPRYPAKKPKTKKPPGEGKEKRMLIGSAIVEEKRREMRLTMPSRRGGQDLVYKPIKVRIHRTCHECGNEFLRRRNDCTCGHVRCTVCPRSPSKKKKYPNGYPGDVPAPDNLAIKPPGVTASQPVTQSETSVEAILARLNISGYPRSPAPPNKGPATNDD
ncbi:MAG: hypothetical protein M1814_000221 [Vezdaea aestivalis]|nr:MAG: hypothetical protein M1814_000221 [Vezdaea aestivalis]